MCIHHIFPGWFGTVIIQLLDNSVFEFLLKMVTVFFQTGNDRKFHAESKLKVIGKDSLREFFMKMQPVFKTIKGFRGIVFSPLSRYLWIRCCDDPFHSTNSEKISFPGDMG